MKMRKRLFLDIFKKGTGVFGIRENSFIHSRTLQPETCNIVLLGYPGSGKTSVGRILGSLLSKRVLDVDDDLLEPYWGMTVAEKLFQVGGENFIEEEGKALLTLKTTGSIVSLSGSNPLHEEAIDSIRKSGIMVYLDCPQEDILHRLHKMKVQRIVGQENGQSMADILRYRQQFYEKHYDLRVLSESGGDVESVSAIVMRDLENYHWETLYESTRGNVNGKPVKLEEAVLQGLAPDGGLYVPEKSLPSFTPGQWKRLSKLSYQQRALHILEKWIHSNAIHPQTLKSFIHTAYNPKAFHNEDIIPLVHLHGNQFVAEVFHGPTASFKDAALQLMPQFFAHSMAKLNVKERYLLLVATSGDTGSAVLDGFSKLADLSQVKVMVLYPEHGVSSMQKALMTSVDAPNVKILGIDGDFDDCQSAIKTIFNDASIAKTLLKKYNTKLSAANSINWGRLLPQVVYHASVYLDLIRKGYTQFGDSCDLCVPTGNFGNILGAIYAKDMGIPFSRFICASNTNNVLTDFFKTGVYDLRERSLKVTSSPAIDILKSSNLERFLYHVSNRDSHLVRQLYSNLQKKGYFQVPDDVMNTIQDKYNITADWCSEEECARTIKETFEQTGYLLDPHTAVGKTVADRLQSESNTIICGTAHYAKFPEDVLRALGYDAGNDLKIQLRQLTDLAPKPEMHPNLKTAVTKPCVHCKTISSSPDEIMSELEQFVGFEN